MNTTINELIKSGIEIHFLTMKKIQPDHLETVCNLLWTSKSDEDCSVSGYGNECLEALNSAMANLISISLSSDK